MPTWMSRLLYAGAALSLAACTPASMQVQQSGPVLFASDSTFVTLAGTSGLTEISFAQLAQLRATDPVVRQFADQMIADHSAIGQQLDPIAISKGVLPPAVIDEPHTIAYAQLENLDGLAFDRAYINGQIEDHTLMVRAFQGEVENGTDPQVHAFAQQYMPMMQQHLRLAQSIASTELPRRRR